MNVDPKQIEQLVRETINSLGMQGQSLSGEDELAKSDVLKDYPLGKKRPDLVSTATGKKLTEITLEGILAGEITADDVRITAETLKLQAEVAKELNRNPLAKNFLRAAELTRIPDKRVLEIYNALRPYRSTKKDLFDIANELKNQYQAVATAELVFEAVKVYEKNGRLRDEDIS